MQATGMAGDARAKLGHQLGGKRSGAVPRVVEPGARNRLVAHAAPSPGSLVRAASPTPPGSSTELAKVLVPWAGHCGRGKGVGRLPRGVSDWGIHAHADGLPSRLLMVMDEGLQRGALPGAGNSYSTGCQRHYCNLSRRKIGDGAPLLAAGDGRWQS